MLATIWARRVASAFTNTDSARSVTRCWRARPLVRSTRTQPPTSSLRSSGWRLSRIFPAVARATSSRSSTSRSRWCVCRWMICRSRVGHLLGARRGARARPAALAMAPSGLRSSWESVARNSSLARLALGGVAVELGVFEEDAGQIADALQQPHLAVRDHAPLGPPDDEEAADRPVLHRGSGRTGPTGAGTSAACRGRRARRPACRRSTPRAEWPTTPRSRGGSGSASEWRRKSSIICGRHVVARHRPQAVAPRVGQVGADHVGAQRAARSRARRVASSRSGSSVELSARLTASSVSVSRRRCCSCRRSSARSASARLRPAMSRRIARWRPATNRAVALYSTGGARHPGRTTRSSPICSPAPGRSATRRRGRGRARRGSRRNVCRADRPAPAPAGGKRQGWRRRISARRRRRARRHGRPRGEPRTGKPLTRAA